MKNPNHISLMCLLFTFVLTMSVQAQDPAVVDSSHYSVVLENDDVRVLRIQYGPGEEGVMHEHPASVAVFLTDGVGLMKMPDGSEQEMSFEKGLAVWTPAGKHHPSNAMDEPFELIQIELKNVEEGDQETDQGY